MKRGILLIFIVLASNFLAIEISKGDITQVPPKEIQNKAKEPPNILEFLCEGCFYNGRCLDVGSQYVGDAGEIYCSTNKKIELAKQDNQACNFNYECKSFYCDKICTRPIQKSNNLFKNVVLALTAVFILLIVLLVFRFFIIKPRVIKKKGITIKEIRKVKPKYKEDKLEEQIKTSMEELKRTFKK